MFWTTKVIISLIIELKDVRLLRNSFKMHNPQVRLGLIKKKNLNSDIPRFCFYTSRKLRYHEIPVDLVQVNLVSKKESILLRQKSPFL